MEQDPSRTCPQCGTPRVGNFRWCRNCQFDFDAGRVSSATPATADTPPAPGPDDPQLVPAFTLTPPPTPAAPAAPGRAPTAPTAPAPSAGASAPIAADVDHAAVPTSRSGIPPRLRLPLAAGGIVAVVLVVALILIPPRSASTGPDASAGASAGTSGAASPAPTRIAAPTPFEPIQLSGTGSEDVAFSIPDGASGLATITNEGTGPFVVWTVAADGTRNDQLVNTIGSFAGTRLFDENKHSTTFSVESDGTWSIEVKPITEARTWDQSERLVGDGPDVIRVVPPIAADLTTTVRYDGTSNFAVSAYATSGKQKLLEVVGPFNGSMPLPAGTSVIEIEADAAWSIDPG